MKKQPKGAFPLDGEGGTRRVTEAWRMRWSLSLIFKFYFFDSVKGASQKSETPFVFTLKRRFRGVFSAWRKNLFQKQASLLCTTQGFVKPPLCKGSLCFCATFCVLLFIRGVSTVWTPRRPCFMAGTPSGVLGFCTRNPAKTLYKKRKIWYIY